MKSNGKSSNGKSIGKSIGKCIGISAFGLNDVLCVDNDLVRGRQDQPACVLLPDQPREPIKAGLAASESHVFSGMQWPEDARIARDDIRRVPVAAAWRRLSESRESFPLWPQKSASLPVSDILAAHVRALLAENDCQPDGGDPCCLVIPNNLDVYAQEALLRSLRNIGMDMERTGLLWRPVAAALSWIAGLMPHSIKTIAYNPNAKLLLIYAGLDAVEITFLGLQAQEDQGRTYILPVRSTPMPPLGLCGLDWGLEMAEACEDICQKDDGALWQAVFRFPQIWQHLAQRPIDKQPMPWSTCDGWRLWHPRLAFDPLHTKACRHPWTSRLAGLGDDWNEWVEWNERNERHTGDDRDQYDGTQSSGNKAASPDNGACPTWQEYLAERLQDCLNSADVAGGILFGPLSSRLAGHPVLAGRLAYAPGLHGIWHAEEDCMAKGAAIYASRQAQGLPTYLDTLPRLEAFSITNGKRSWIDLVPTSAVKGGQFYNHSISSTFALLPSKPELEMYLRLGGDGENQEENTGQDICTDNIRKAVVTFPETPTKDEPLRLHVRMRPASGLAQLELVPQNSSFLKGRKIPLDFEKLVPATLPKDTTKYLKYPENLKREVQVPASVWMREPAVQNLLTFSWTDCEREDVAEAILTGLEYLKDVETIVEGRKTYPVRIDQNGKTDCTEGNKMVQAIAKQVEMFWYCFCQYHRNRLRRFITRATYLWRATPQVVIDAIYDILADHSSKNPQYKYLKLDDKNLGYVYEAAGRCFSQEKQYKMMFLTFEQRNRNSLNIEFTRPLYRVLTYTPKAKKYIDDRFAYLLVNASLKAVTQELKKRKKYLSRRFFVALHLFMVALMQRKNNNEFMIKNSNKIADLYYKFMSEQLAYAKHVDRRSSISKIIDGVLKYMDCKGESGLMEIIDSRS